jgi:hypothetical protein
VLIFQEISNVNYMNFKAVRNQRSERVKYGGIEPKKIMLMANNGNKIVNGSKLRVVSI